MEGVVLTRENVVGKVFPCEDQGSWNHGCCGQRSCKKGGSLLGLD